MPLTKLQRDEIGSIFTGACINSKICPVKDVMARYGDKWTMYTILQLAQHKQLRFNELKKSIVGISQRMLAVTLKCLEHDGLIKRTICADNVTKAVYELTFLGESLATPILQLAVWAKGNLDEIIIHRKSSGCSE